MKMRYYFIFTETASETLIALTLACRRQIIYLLFFSHAWTDDGRLIHHHLPLFHFFLICETHEMMSNNVSFSRFFPNVETRRKEAMFYGLQHKF